jgi:prepilin-type N-terminal cleavage/methylation domain-containing protein
MKNERGFTLIEVLLAVGLISVALLAMSGMMTTAYRTIDRSGEHTAASVLCLQRLEFLRNQAFTSSTLNAGTTTETLTGTYAGYSRITTIVDNTPRAGVKRLTVQTSAPSGVSAQTVSYMTTP